MSLAVDSLAQSRRRERVTKLYLQFAQNGLSLRDKELAEFSFETGASEEKATSYYRILLASGRLIEHIENGMMWTGTPSAWDAAEKETAMKKNRSLDEHS